VGSADEQKTTVAPLALRATSGVSAIGRLAIAPDEARQHRPGSLGRS